MTSTMTDVSKALGREAQVHLWLTDPGLISDPALLERYETMLGEEEQASYQELQGAEHRREYLISQAFLRDVLAFYTGIEPSRFEFERNASGKPALSHVGPELMDLHFNLSRSPSLMACCVSYRGKVGVDVEPLDSGGGMLDMAEHYFSPDEVQALMDLPDSARRERFCQVWTLKEAYVKARGEGLSRALDSFSFGFDNEGHIHLREQAAQGEDWQFWSLQPAAGHLTAVAVAASGCELRVFSGIPLCDQRELVPGDLGLVA